jgi:solute carrier family 25 uncoupling protein 8/9
MKYKGILGTCMTMAKEEGIGALWKGSVAGVQRQLIFAALRIGLYEKARSLCTPKDKLDSPPLLSKIAAGLLTGSFGIAVANPTVN